MSQAAQSMSDLCLEGQSVRDITLLNHNEDPPFCWKDVGLKQFDPNSGPGQGIAFNSRGPRPEFA